MRGSVKSSTVALAPGSSGLGGACGEQHARLDFHEGGGHDEELAGEVDVEAADDLDVFEVLVGDLGDGDVLDVHLGLFDEEEEELEGPGVDFEVDFVIFGLGHGVEDSGGGGERKERRRW